MRLGLGSFTKQPGKVFEYPDIGGSSLPQTPIYSPKCLRGVFEATHGSRIADEKHKKRRVGVRPSSWGATRIAGFL